MSRAVIEPAPEIASGKTGRRASRGLDEAVQPRFLAQRHPDVTGVDLSPRMIEIARRRSPGLAFEVATMLQLPVADGAWTGAVASYSIIHLTALERAAACRELGRAVRPGGWLLVAFHVSSEDFAAGDVHRVTNWFGEPVALDGYFLDPDEVADQMEEAGFTVTARLEREPVPDGEYPSRRCYLLAQRSAICDCLPSSPPGQRL